MGLVERRGQSVAIDRQMGKGVRGEAEQTCASMRKQSVLPAAKLDLSRSLASGLPRNSIRSPPRRWPGVYSPPDGIVNKILRN